MLILSEQTFPAALDDRLRDAYGVTAELLSDIVSEACRRFPSNGGNAKAARVERNDRIADSTIIETFADGSQRITHIDWAIRSAEH